eukprot:15153936-Alexandrium_andersonii.AAC.1
MAPELPSDLSGFPRSGSLIRNPIGCHPQRPGGGGIAVPVPNQQISDTLVPGGPRKAPPARAAQHPWVEEPVHE